MTEKTNIQETNIKAKSWKEEAILWTENNLANALTTEEKYNEIVDKLTNKPNMTEADKENMRKVIKYLEEINYNQIAYLEHLDSLLEYTPETIKIGKHYEIARQYPEWWNGIYHEETKKRYYKSIDDVPVKKGFMAINTAHLPIWQLSKNATYYKNFKGSLVLPLLLWLQQDGYIESDGSLYGNKQYGNFGLGGSEYYEFEYNRNFGQLRTINMENCWVIYLQVKSSTK